MVKNLKRAKKLLEKEGRASDYDFFPQTYVLPLEHGIFVEEFRRNPGEKQWQKHLWLLYSQCRLDLQQFRLRQPCSCFGADITQLTGLHDTSEVQLADTACRHYMDYEALWQSSGQGHFLAGQTESGQQAIATLACIMCCCLYSNHTPSCRTDHVI